MKFSRRNFLTLAGLGGVGLALGWRVGLEAKPAPPTPLYVLAPNRSWSPSLLIAFQQATGVMVVRRPAPETLAEVGDFDLSDLAIVPAYALTGLIQQGRVQELNRLSLSTLLEQRPYDPLNAFSLPAARGAIGINTRGLTPPATWAEFFELAKSEPAYLPCPEAHHAVLKMSGESLNTRNAFARQRVGQILAGLKSESLESVRLAVGPALPGWNFAVPTEGAELWEDCYCIPTASPQPAWAQTFMRFAVEQQPLAALPVGDLEPRSAFHL